MFVFLLIWELFISKQEKEKKEKKADLKTGPSSSVDTTLTVIFTNSTTPSTTLAS